MAEYPVLYILTGRPFAGKTTLAKVLNGVVAGTYISIDDMLNEQDIGLSGERVRQPSFELLHGVAMERARSLLQAGETVVYDSTIYRRTREHLSAIARESGAAAITVYVDTPEAETYRRYERNLFTQERNSHHPTQLVEFTKTFEPPSATEKHLVFHAGENIAEWISNNIKG